MQENTPQRRDTIPQISTAHALRSMHDVQISGHSFTIQDSEIPIPHSTMWLPQDRPIIDTGADLISLLHGYNEDSLSEHAPKNLDQSYMEKYLYMTNIRVANLVDLLVDRLPRGSTILEIGSFFGSFSLSLQRLGYKVTAIDRYDEFKGRFDGYVSLMRDEGVDVIRANRDTEADLTSRLPHFDAVIAMAVIEHIPHAAKGFLEYLKSKVKPGGIIAVDTPNVARYWNRQRLSAGETIFQALDQQFFCTPPWEGHHREYTPKEVPWMLEQIGCHNVTTRTFDYNMLQFERIDRPHIDCFEACIRDPSMADTIVSLGSTSN